MDTDSDDAILLVPVGPVDDPLLGWLVEQLPVALDRDLQVGAMLPLPDRGYDPERRQYRADAVLSALHTLFYPGAERIVGLVDADCYAPGLNFVFGQARLKGREAFVALPRLRPSFYGQPADVGLFHRRVLKEVVHELGHTWGLHHCPDPRCVMHFSNTLADTDVKGVRYCPSCQAQL
jgi:archaemetzincin